MEAAKRKPAGMTDGRSNQEGPGAVLSLQDNRAGASANKATALWQSDSTTRPPEKKGLILWVYHSMNKKRLLI